MSKNPGKKSSWLHGAISVGWRGKKYRSIVKAQRALRRAWKKERYVDLYSYQGGFTWNRRVGC